MTHWPFPPPSHPGAHSPGCPASSTCLLQELHGKEIAAMMARDDLNVEASSALLY